MSEKKDFKVYAAGLTHASVCSSLSLEETTHRLNKEMPSGTRRGWQPCEDKKFKSGEPNPCRCEEAPKTHKHYLFDC